MWCLDSVGMKSLLYLVLLALIIFKSAAAASGSRSIVETLPGYAGPLPFKLETGYIGVGDDEEVQLFYYFIESENDPRRDPLFLWLTGGPGCFAFSGLVYEIGPLAFDVENFDGSLPSFLLNPYSWTKAASIIFVDSPVGTGFSYSNTSKGYATSDTKATQDIYTFLRKWLLSHPEFIENHLFVAGDSYSGKIVPVIALQIAKGNEAGLEPIMSLNGYIVGNSVADEDENINERIPYYHRVALISDQQFLCTKLNTNHILEPICTNTALEPWLVDDPVGLLSINGQKCRDQNYVTSEVWANNETVREALHIREGTVSNWRRCNWSLQYESDIKSAIAHHQILGDMGFPALVYSGDQDTVVPYMCTLKWIQRIDVTVNEEWRPYIVDGQVAGYTEKYKNRQAYITFATVKGAGHTAPEYKPRECLAMIRRWLSLHPL